ncbi:hypothetical protein NIIDMKKI_57310 [Mycobacterium kansasii]|uniref:Uncharacterized protein n=1 Tax=Mycobacterium kansasii TaxID=1768 RepID=A0A7G1ILA9_MYCKA|nr:hypothetical protein NIIDMKKI_57310 [Mycobacterium kansasii]
MAVAGAAGDASGPSAFAADSLRPISAPRADRLALPVAAGDGFDYTTAHARGRQLAASAASAHAPGRRTGQWLAGASATGADRIGQVHPACPQFGDQAAHHRRCADGERIGIGGQGGGQERMTAGWPATASSAALSTPIGIPGTAAATAVLIRPRPQPLHNRPWHSPGIGSGWPA